MRAPYFLALYIAICTCHRSSAPEQAQPGPVGSPEPRAPTPLAEIRANDGAIAKGNLESQIESLGKQGQDPSIREALVNALLMHGQYFGRIADYERAAAVAEGFVKDLPKLSFGYVLRARTHAVFHRFGAAEEDLQRAISLGLAADKLTPVRASNLASLGKLDEAAALMPKDLDALDTMGLASVALLAGEMGDPARRDQLLIEARKRVPDTSPFSYAWIDAHQGEQLESAGEILAAKMHYRRALNLISGYARVAAHLAPLSRPEEAIAMLEFVAKEADDPEITTQLADAYRRADRAADAARLTKDAATRYEELTTKYPEAFADHAATFWLGLGGDPKKALSFAKMNEANRPTIAAEALLMNAALATHDEAASCRAASTLIARKYVGESLRARAKAIADKCKPRAP